MHLGERIDELALGTLGGHEKVRAEKHVRECRECREELREAEEALTLLALELAPVEPPPGLVERIAKAAASSGRFDEFTSKVAELYGVSGERARELLRYLDESSRWNPGPTSEIDMMPVEAGAEYSRHLSMVVRVRAGSVFPWHEHLGDEHFVVLSGSCVEPDGTVFRPGEIACNRVGTAHDFTVPADGDDFIFAVRLTGMLAFKPRAEPDGNGGDTPGDETASEG